MTTTATDIGQKELPAGWKWVKLGDVIANVQPGFACGTRAADGVVQLRMNNVTRSGGFDWDELTRVPSDFKDMSKYWLQPNDVLFNNTNSAELVGKSALFESFTEGVVYSNHFSRLRPDDQKLDARFLAKWLLDTWTKGTFESICNRWVGQAAVQKTKLLELFIPLPPLVEQKRIAGILNEQMAAVEEAKKAAQERLEAVKALPAAYLREMFEGEEAKGWQLKHLGEFILTAMNGFGRRPKGEEQGPIVLRIADVSSGEVDLSNPRRIEMTDKERHKYALAPDDLLFIRVNGSANYVGKCIGVAETQEILAYNDHLIRVRVQDTFSTDFLVWFLNSHSVREHMIEKASTSAGQLTINQKAISDIQVPLLGKELQQRISSELDDKIAGVKLAEASIQQELATIEAMPAALLRKAFSGGL